MASRACVKAWHCCRPRGCPVLLARARALDTGRATLSFLAQRENAARVETSRARAPPCRRAPQGRDHQPLPATAATAAAGWIPATAAAPAAAGSASTTPRIRGSAGPTAGTPRVRGSARVPATAAAAAAAAAAGLPAAAAGLPAAPATAATAVAASWRAAPPGVLFTRAGYVTFAPPRGMVCPGERRPAARFDHLRLPCRRHEVSPQRLLTAARPDARHRYGAPAKPPPSPSQMRKPVLKYVARCSDALGPSVRQPLCLGARGQRPAQCWRVVCTCQERTPPLFFYEQRTPRILVDPHTTRTRLKLPRVNPPPRLRTRPAAVCTVWHAGGWCAVVRPAGTFR